MKILYHVEVDAFIKNLAKPIQYKVLRTIDLLEKNGNLLRMPHSKKITEKLYELRSRGEQEIRLLYCYKGNSAFILHGFIKKSNKTPSHEIKTALKRIP